MTLVDLPQRRPVPHSFNVELYRGDQLAAADWPSIADPRDLEMHVFQSREFLEVWINTIGQANHVECYLAVVTDRADRPVLYLPLAIEAKFNVRLLRFIDFGVADYNAPILAADAALSRQDFTAMWSRILALLPAFDVIDLKKMPSWVEGVFNPLAYLDCAPFGESGHVMQLSGLSAEADMRPSVKRMRKKLRYYRKALNKIGEGNFIINPAADDLKPIATRLIELKHQKYKRSETPDFLEMAGVERFYSEMMSPGRIGIISHLSALTVGDTIASAHLGFTGRGRFHYVLSAYDIKLQNYSAGHLLLEHLIDQCSAQGFKTFDLGIGNNLYKDTWATHRLALYTHERAVTAAGRLYLQMRRVGRFVKAGGVRTWFRPAS